MKVLMVGMLMVGLALSATQSSAKSRSIAGFWKGGGNFTTASGNRERTSCRATIQTQTARKFYVSASCAISGFGIITQSGTIRRVGKNRYRGRFTNYDYGIKGSITIVHRGNKQHITFRSPEGRAHVTLRRGRRR